MVAPGHSTSFRTFIMTTLLRRIVSLTSMVVILAPSGPLFATAEETAQEQNKIRVAVMNIENHSDWSYWGNTLGSATTDELITQLFKTSKFSLVERTQLEAVLAEQNLGQSGMMDPSQAAKIGQLLGVQLILTGSITKFSVDTKRGGFRSFRAEYSEAESNIDIRLINTNTAEIVFADSGEGKVRLGGVRVKGVNFRQDFDEGLVQESIRPAIEDVVRKIVDQADVFASVQTPIAPAKVVGVSAEGALYIDKGKNYGVVVGQRYEVNRAVDEIRDASGNLLDTIIEPVGVIAVTRVLDQSAICTIVEGEAATGDVLKPIR